MKEPSLPHISWRLDLSSEGLYYLLDRDKKVASIGFGPGFTGHVLGAKIGEYWGIVRANFDKPALECDSYARYSEAGADMMIHWGGPERRVVQMNVNRGRA